jgi:hypothetical protein
MNKEHEKFLAFIANNVKICFGYEEEEI